jgi:hypothetical protein
LFFAPPIFHVTRILPLTLSTSFFSVFLTLSTFPLSFFFSFFFFSSVHQFFLFSLLFAGSVMPVYRSLNMALTSPWVAEGVLAFLAASLTWVAHSSVQTKRAYLRLRMGELSDKHLCSSGGRETSVVLRSLAKETSHNEALLSYYALLLLKDPPNVGTNSHSSSHDDHFLQPTQDDDEAAAAATASRRAQIEASWGLPPIPSSSSSSSVRVNLDQKNFQIRRRDDDDDNNNSKSRDDTDDSGDWREEVEEELLCDGDLQMLDDTVRRWLVEVAFPERPHCEALLKGPLVTEETLRRLEALGLAASIPRRSSDTKGQEKGSEKEIPSSSAVAAAAAAVDLFSGKDTLLPGASSDSKEEGGSTDRRRRDAAPSQRSSYLGLRAIPWNQVLP